MWLNKHKAGAKNDDEVVAAIVMPLAGHSDDEVKELLTNLHAEVSPLSEGFLSVKATRLALNKVSAIARVEPKVLKQMHLAILKTH